MSTPVTHDSAIAAPDHGDLDTELTADPVASLAPANTGGSRRGARRAIVVLVAVVAVAVTVLILFRSPTSSIPFAPDNPDAAGTRAVAQILERQGVKIAFVQNADDAATALTSAPGSATLVVGGDFGLTSDQVEWLAEAADEVVLFAPGDGTLEAFAPQISVNWAAAAAGTLEARCRDADAIAAEEITQASPALYSSNAEAVSCFTSDDGAAMIRLGTVTALSSEAWITNEHLAEAGNAALGLRLLGTNEHVVWFVPDLIQMLGVSEADQEASHAWIMPVFLVLVGVIAVAAWWRGRRFGALIPEPLPVTVRPEEVSQGRARLYRASRDYGYSGALVRAGTLTRIASHLGVPAGTDRASLVIAICSATGRPPATVDHLCYGPPPSNADDLLRLTNELDQLFREVRQA